MTEETVQTEDIIEDVEITEEVVEVTAEGVEVEENEEEKPSRSQGAKERLKRKLRESEQRESQMARQLTDLSMKVEGLINPPKERPGRVDFETEEDYEDALFDWRAGNSNKPVQTQQFDYSNQQPVKPQPMANSELEENWEDQVEVAEEKYSDFQMVINNPNIPITFTMAEAIKGMDIGGEVAYYLGKNPKEADKIARMTLTNQIRSLDQLGNKFKSTTTTAPDPITPVKGGDSPAKDVSKMSTEEYRDYRRAQMAQRR